ncbi:electron transport complex subunit RsxC [Candidatus Saganbacteria bacterium]|nr:electron transport complex subunit RsxC [Candidatus Saganbacteria bacterium]
MNTFSGGLHLKYNKESTEFKPIKELPSPQRVVIPLQQNLGCPNDPLVKVGDEVYEGQKIGDSPKFVSAPVHASISGKVTKIEKLPNPCGFDVASVVIEAGGGAKGSVMHNAKTLEELTPDEIRRIVREAGIVGMGGATFPTHVKLTPPAGKLIDTLIINGCECEPYITADHRLMLERADDIIFGSLALAKAVGAQNILIGVEDNKKDAVGALSTSDEKHHLGKNSPIKIVEVETKYPQGGEKQLIKTLLDREVPSGKLPLEVGAVVNNVGTAAAVAAAIKHGTPLIKRVLTVTGPGMKERHNFLVRIGTSFEEVLKHSEGLMEDASRIVMGGPMMGLAVSSLDLPVVKGTTCLLVFNRKEARIYEEKDCIRCGRCIKHCPAGLMPNFLSDYVKLKDWEKVEEYHVADCIECGCCSYVCPSRIFLVQYFKAAKRELQVRKAVCQ